MQEQAHPDSNLTQLLSTESSPDPDRVVSAFRERLEFVRTVASRLMWTEKADHTLQPTALAHEAFLRLVDQSRVTSRGASHFRGCIARECRRILVEHARRRSTEARGGKLATHSLDQLGSRLAVSGKGRPHRPTRRHREAL